MQGETYQRVYQAAAAPSHLVTSLHQAHLSSLAEDSEEGSDQVSESDGGLIHDDDLAAEPAPAAASDQVSICRVVASSSKKLTCQLRKLILVLPHQCMPPGAFICLQHQPVCPRA